jgi:hypothetical protein
MFSSLPSFDAAMQPWQLNLLCELFPQIVSGNDVERPLGVSHCFAHVLACTNFSIQNPTVSPEDVAQ